MRTAIVILALAVALASCESAAKKQARKDKERLDKSIAAQGFQTVTLGLIAGDAKAINTTTERINAMLSEKGQMDLGALKVRVEGITDSAGRISDNAKSMDATLAQQKKEFWRLKHQVDDCREAQDAPLLALSMKGIWFGGIVVICGMIAAAFAKSFPIPLLAAGGNLSVVGLTIGGLSLGLRLFVQFIGPYRVVGGIVAIGCICFAMIWFTWKSLRGYRVRTINENLRRGIRNASVIEKVSEVTDDPATQQFLASIKPTT